MRKIVTLALLFLMVVSAVPATAGGAPVQNKKNAMAFIQNLVGDRDYEAAKQYVGPNYIQHDPRIAEDGLDALVEALETHPLWKNRPIRKNMKVQNVVAEGDLVYLQYPREGKTLKGDDFRLLVVHVFRFDANGKIDEHWSAAGHVLMKETKNKHPLF